MEENQVIHALFLIFAGASVVATLALVCRQALIIGYILIGIILGPFCLDWIPNTEGIKDMAGVGIIFLLFMLGLNLVPQKLIKLFGQTSFITFLTSLGFFVPGLIIGYLFKFNINDSFLIGIACMFSSTIIGLKLLPTTVLHHKHTGEVIISILLLQDIIAIFVMLWLGSKGAHAESGGSLVQMAKVIIALPLMALGAWAFARYVLLKLIRKFDKVQEYIFLVSVGWCLGMAEIAHHMGLSHEIGAFIAGITIATSPIALFIADSLKPLRDFFLVMFFFALGATIDLSFAGAIFLPAILLALAILILKPLLYRALLIKVSETKSLAWETGWRLGQMSEFSLLIVFVALELGQLSTKASSLIQLATIMTFIGSSFIVVMNFPSPVAVSEKLRRD